MCCLKDGVKLEQVRPHVNGFVGKPTLTLCLNQGSVGWSGGHYLMYQPRFRLILLHDIKYFRMVVVNLLKYLVPSGMLADERARTDSTKECAR